MSYPARDPWLHHGIDGKANAAGLPGRNSNVTQLQTGNRVSRPASASSPKVSA